MQKKFKALRLIGTLYKILGILVGVLAILAALAFCATSIFGGAAFQNLGQELGRDTPFAGAAAGAVGGILLGLVMIINGGVLAITLYAIGEGVYLLLAIEENTHTAAALLQNQPAEPM